MISSAPADKTHVTLNDEGSISAPGGLLLFLLTKFDEGPKEPDPVLQPRPSRGAETVLVVDDERAVRSIVARALLRSGYTVLQAGSGREALAIYERHLGSIDLLVTDVVMPEMGGRELADRLTAASPGLRVLFVSGYTDDEVVRRGVFHEQVHFLAKPLSPAALVQKVRDVLSAPE